MASNIAAYWSKQSEGYSQINQEELDTDMKAVWLRLIKEHQPKREGLKVLDAGCGPGFFTILMAQQGYEVTAIDFSEEMIRHALENVNRYCPEGDVSFIQMDAQKLAFESDTFDLILSRNITWNLRQPEAAYKEWLRVLKPGGRILNFDGNWRMQLFDTELAKQCELAEEELKELGYEILPNGHDEEAAGETLDHLPLERVQRPEWDRTFFEVLGGNKVSTLDRLPEGIMNEYYTTLYKYIPMFMVKVEKHG